MKKAAHFVAPFASSRDVFAQYTLVGRLVAPCDPSFLMRLDESLIYEV